MTVGELIEALSTIDPNTLVFATEENAADGIEPSEDGTDYVAIDVWIKEH